MPTFTIEDNMISGGSSSNPLVVALDFTDVGGVGVNDPGEVTFLGEAGLDDIDIITLTGIGGNGGGTDADIMTFDLSTFNDDFSIAVIQDSQAPGADDWFIFEGADTIVDNGDENWTVTYSNGGPTFTLNVFAGAAQVGNGADGVIDGEDTGETMGVGYNDDNAPNDGGGDIIDGADGDNDSIRGNGGNDTINAGSGDDSVDGGAGNDVIDGGAGNDFIIGDEPETIEIINPSFETNVVTDGNFDANVTDWTEDGTDIGEYNPSSTQVDESTVTGENVAYLHDDGDKISQTLGINYEDGAIYEFTFDLGDGNFSGGESADYAVRIYAGNTEIGSTTGSTNDINALSSVTVSSSGYSGTASGAIRIEFEKVTGGELLIDNVQGTIVGGTSYDSDDSISGGSGNDTIYGDFNDDSVGRAGFQWNEIPDPDNGGLIDEGDEITVGSQVVGNVTVNYNLTGVSGEFTNNTQYVTGIDAGTSTVGNNSAMSFETNGNAEVTFSTPVENVEFRVNDFDAPYESLTIRVYDENNQLTNFDVTRGDEVTGSNTDAVAGEDSFQGVNGGGSNSDSDPDGSILVQISGATTRIEFDFSSNGSGKIALTDIWFDNPATGNSGNDTIDGGVGADMLFGNGGNDIINVDQGDTAEGGDGDDTFILQDLDTTGTGNASIDIIGGEGDETNGDTLQLTPDVTFGDINFTNNNDAAGGLSGNFTMADGTVVTFSEIENIICFTASTLILTNQGERPVESLKRGDNVLTRDHGFQPIRWIGQRAVEGKGRFAPVRFAAEVLKGASGDLIVSPQHRVVFEGYKAQLLFGESEVFAAAKHLVDGINVVQDEVPSVTYFHIMFDEHEVIYSNGIPTESFHAGDTGLSSITDAAREELFSLFPDLRHWSGGHGPTARSSLKRYEAELLRNKLIG